MTQSWARFGQHRATVYTALAGTPGILIGTVFLAFHASQGAELGLPPVRQLIRQAAPRAPIGEAAIVIVDNICRIVCNQSAPNGIKTTRHCHL
jgi:nucleobase:cation symporter-1, NCS1 family